MVGFVLLQPEALGRGGTGAGGLPDKFQEAGRSPERA